MLARARHSCGRARSAPSSRSVRGQGPSPQHDFKALVAFALVFGPSDVYPAYFAGVGDVRPTVSLLVDALDVDHADFLDALGNQVDFGPDQVRDLKSLGTRQEPNRYGVFFAEKLVGTLLDRFQTVLGEIGQEKIHACPIWVHLATGNGRAIQLIDHTAHRVQRGVV